MSKSGFVDQNGVSLHYLLDDSATGAPWLVFSNSLMTSTWIWKDQAEALKSRFRILRYDQRGHGKSSVSPGPVTFDDLVDDLAALVEFHDIQKFSFVGLSMGVPTGLGFYSRYPGKIERLVLSDGQSKTAPDGRKAWQDRIDDAREKGMEQYAHSVLDRWFSKDFQASPDGQMALKMIAQTPLEGFAACAGALQDYDFEHVLPTIKVPVQLIAGELDGNMPDNMRLLCNSIDDARFLTVPKAGHLPNLENPKAFTQILDQFLTGN